MPRYKKPLGLLFRSLNQLAASDLAARHGLRELTQRVVYWGTRAGAQTGAQAVKLARSRFPAVKKMLDGEGLKRPGPAAGSGGATFDLTLTDEQELTRETVRRFSADAVRPFARAADTEDAPDTSSFDDGVAALGLNLIAIPESLGGAGELRSPVSTALLAEDLAHGDMGLALAALAPCSFINTLTEFGSPAQQGRYLPRFCDEAFLPASVALMEPRARFDPRYLETRARPVDGGYRLEGVKCMVPLVERAEVFVVFAELAGRGPRGFLVEASAPGLQRARARHMGLHGAGLGRLELRGVLVEPSALLGASPGDGETAAYDHQRAIDLARVGTCALAVGTCQAVLDYVIEYCNARVAFGEPISHRQAVAFTIADMAIELEAMRLMTYRAASRAERGQSFQREAYLARTLCADKAMAIGSHGVQLLGGHGYVCEHPVERWYRQLRASAILEGALLL